MKYLSFDSKITKTLSFCLLFLCAACESNNDKKQHTETKKPNIIVILTDQERHPTHWPANWAENNLQSTNRLKKVPKWKKERRAADAFTRCAKNPRKGRRDRFIFGKCVDIGSLFAFS